MRLTVKKLLSFKNLYKTSRNISSFRLEDLFDLLVFLLALAAVHCWLIAYRRDVLVGSRVERVLTV